MWIKRPNCSGHWQLKSSANPALPNSGRNSLHFAWELNFAETRILARMCLTCSSGRALWAGSGLTLLESGTRKVGLKIGVDHPMEENWRPVFVGSGGIFERHQGVSGRVKRVSRQGVWSGGTGRGLLRQEIVCWPTCLMFAYLPTMYYTIFPCNWSQ